ncbi:MAG: hypothetical protein KDB87_07240, partial [Flavobacteriales bacterium]|nr:hypothetical protein [Flavobacteriales bacterium]
EGLGDFSALVKEEGLGLVVRGDEVGPLARPLATERARLMAFAKERFTKEAHREAYARLLGELGA